jgi:hypothetical protein
MSTNMVVQGLAPRSGITARKSVKLDTGNIISDHLPFIDRTEEGSHSQMNGFYVPLHIAPYG